MEIVVCIKQVPDTTEVKIDPATNTLVRKGVPSIVNPFDKNAVEAALQLREKHGGRVTVISIGPPQAKAALKECIAMGADTAILISDRAFGGADTLATSYTLAAAIKKLEVCDMIICGKQAIDGDTAQVGLEMAEHLGIAQITYAARIEVEGNNVRVERETEEGYEIIEVKLPLLPFRYFAQNSTIEQFSNRMGSETLGQVTLSTILEKLPLNLGTLFVKAKHYAIIDETKR